MNRICKNNMTLEKLRDRGYTYSSAARALKCSPTHVWLVINGKRTSARLTERLRKLPKRQLKLREPRKEVAV